MMINPNDGLKFNMDALKTIYLAGGCFWGVDAYMKRVLGVYETECGYANGDTENPTYEEVCHNNTGHAETVKVVYDSAKISLNELLGEFFSIMNPTTLNRQAGDIGSQYRSGVYYTDEADKEIITAFIALKQKDYDKPIVTEVLPLENYYRAEDYHQNYLDKNPNGYCHVNLSKFKES
ncbi:peptide-methionine (S)-S-oxide reductase MsrA [Tyzzerella sp. OttesenSCG-928-J15]|nr:peptide-methionine (S)-S-oxide reductase MsrA [Tyzzerella sp. OttesenSCG-928-J15]